jgi:hypothetical protein
LIGCDAAHRPARNVLHHAALALAQIKLVEMDAVQIFAMRAEWMEVAFADPAPVHEFDAEFVGALRRPYEFVLVDPEHAVEGDDRGDRRLADADRADLV